MIAQTKLDLSNGFGWNEWLQESGKDYRSFGLTYIKVADDEWMNEWMNERFIYLKSFSFYKW